MKKLSFLLPAALALVAGAADNPKSRVLIWQERIRAARGNPVFVDGVEVGNLRQRWSYFVLQLAPGEHAISGRHKENELVLKVSAGTDYFIRLDQLLTVNGGEKPTLTTCAEARTVVDSGKLHPVEPHDVRDNARVGLAMIQPACGDK